MLKVIFACIHNAGRSQMARHSSIGLRTHRRQPPSAGTEPGVRVHPEVLAVMQEVGIDLSHAKPQKLTEELAKDAQLLITMGCGDKRPYVPGLRRDDWPLQDPKDCQSRRSVQYVRQSSVACKTLWMASK